MDDTERDALLIRLDERTLRADNALFGNGQSGLVAHVAALGQAVKDIDRRTPTVGEKRAGGIAIAVALIAAVGTVVVSWSTRGAL